MELTYSDDGSVSASDRRIHLIVESKEKAVERLLKKGKQLRSSGSYKEAIKIFTEVVNLDPTNKKAFYNRGWAYDDMEEYQKAIVDFNKSIEIDPQYADAFNNRGNSYSSLKEHQRAIEDYTNAILFAKESRWVYFCNRGDTYRDQKKYRTAILDYDRAIKENPKYTVAYNQRGVAYHRLKEYRKAIADYSEAIKLEPNISYFYGNRGQSYHVLKEYEKTVTDCTRAIEMDPYSNAYKNRALGYLGLGKYQMALDDCEKALEMYPENWKAYRVRGLVFQEMKQYDEAIKDFLKAAECCPEEIPEMMKLVHEATNKKFLDSIHAISILTNSFEDLKRENKELKKKMRIENEVTSKLLDSLRKENEELNKKQVDLERKLHQQEQKLEEVKMDYLDHKEERHTLKFGILSIESTKMSQNPKTKEFTCFEGKHELEISFKMLVGKLSGAFDFSDLKLTLNDEPVEDIMKMPRSIEFDLDFSKPGKNVLILEFKNIKKKRIINVISSKISCSKSELFLQKKESKESTNQEFKVNEEIEVYVHFRNEEGLGIPFEALEDLDLLMKVKPFGSKKKMKGVGGVIDLDEEMFLGDGMILLSTFKLSEGTKVGKYQIVVIGEDLKKTSLFFVQ